MSVLTKFLFSVRKNQLWLCHKYPKDLVCKIKLCPTVGRNVVFSNLLKRFKLKVRLTNVVLDGGWFLVVHTQ